MATGHFPPLTLRENRASAGKPRAFRRLIPFEAAGGFLGPNADASEHLNGLLCGRSGSPAPGPAAFVPPQIFRGYQWVEPRSEPRRGPVLACVDWPLPLSGCLPRMRAAP